MKKVQGGCSGPFHTAHVYIKVLWAERDSAETHKSRLSQVFRSFPPLEDLTTDC